MMRLGTYERVYTVMGGSRGRGTPCLATLTCADGPTSCHLPDRRNASPDSAPQRAPDTQVMCTCLHGASLLTKRRLRH